MKRGFAAVLALAFIAFLGYACDTGGGSSTTGGIVTESVRVNGASAAKLYYPRNINGPMAATTMSAGYTQNLNNVEWLSKRLAEQGYVVLGMTPSNILGMVNGWTSMHKNGIKTLQDLSNSHSKLKGMIDTSKLQISGHSKGGGGSLAAGADLGGSVASVVAMAPYCGGEYSMASLRSMRADTFIQAGANDTLATNSMTRNEFDSLPNGISKMYQEYSGMGHMSFTNGATGSTANKLSEDSIAWMKYNLDGDQSARGTLADKSGTVRHEWKE
jgi:dienelactone hydrolase